MTKKDRHGAILSIIEKQEIGTQEELTESLINLGFDVSQSTVSRDINLLDLIKVEGSNKKFKYAKANLDRGNISPQTINLLKHITLSMEYANNLIVIKTLGGHASAAALAIDDMKFSQVLGTVAGDDTLLVVAKSNTDAEIIIKSLRSL